MKREKSYHLVELYWNICEDRFKVKGNMFQPVPQKNECVNPLFSDLLEMAIPYGIGLA
jgi:hypothetical protein